MTNKEINAAYIGSEQVDKIYLGEDLVYGGEAPEPIYSAMPLTFEVISAGTINFRKSANNAPAMSVSYSKDDGETWTTITATTGTTNAIQVQPGDKVQFKGSNASYATSNDYYDTFFGNGTYASTATVKVYGNIMSLISDTGFTTATTLNTTHTFSGMFINAGDKLVDASNLILPATTLANYCYANMLRGCTSLTTAPELPATSLKTGCYGYMFHSCTSLTTAPELPATTLAQQCYASMLSNCTSLTDAPVLSATTLAARCYQSMFYGCTSLTTAPALPATALTQQCYSYMFDGCTSLTTAPELPATTLVTSCYERMFQNCTNLNYINCHAVIPNDAYTNYWANGVAATGTFVKNPDANWTRSVSGIPSGWTVQDYVDPASIPVLKIAGQSIPGTYFNQYCYTWDDLDQYSASTCTMEISGETFTVDRLEQNYTHTNTCGIEDDSGHDTIYNTDQLDAIEGYITHIQFVFSTVDSYVILDSELNEYIDTDENRCTCEGGEWDGENCIMPVDPCDDWEGNGYSSYEDCRCQEYGEGCEEPSDPCDDWEGNGYSSYEECTCAERGENCPEEESGE